MASELLVNKITPESGTTLTLGESGDTISFASGVLPSLESLTITGDLTVDTNTLYVDSTNNYVGIGTATPSSALDIVGNIAVSGTVDGRDIATDGTKLDTIATNATANPNAIDNVVEDTTPQLGGNLDLNSNDITGTGNINITGNATVSGDLTVDTDTLYVDSANNSVGIGTTTINANLSVYDSSQSDDFTLGIFTSEAAGTGETQSLIKILKSGTGTEYGGAIGGYLSQGVGSGLTLNTLNGGTLTEIMRLQNNGNVGIGTDSPSKTLDIDGQLRIRNGGATGYGLLEYGASATATNNWHVGSEGDGSFRFYNGNFGSGIEKMRIDSSGHAIIPNGVTLGTAVGTYNAANTLDDYEEGTWTPTASGYGGTITFSEAHYTKIGRFVFCTYKASFDTTNDGSDYGVTLPFTPKLITSGVFGGHINYITNTPQTNLTVLIDNNSAAHALADYNGNIKDFDQVKNTSSTMDIRVSLYFMT